MSGKLDQSLDTIMAETGANKAGRGRGHGRRQAPARAATRPARTTTLAPTGGIQKTTRAARIPVAPAVQPQGEGKIMVSNLPLDISETQLKDFFAKAVGGVKKVLLSYGPNGRSRGEATVFFLRVDKATEAVKAYNGVKVDNKAMKIELIGMAVPANSGGKTLADRMAKPKNAAKENAKKAVVGGKPVGAKPAANGAAATTARGAGRGKKSGRGAGRPKAKTAEELDAEMQDYFNPAAETNGAAPAATNGGGEAAMQTDEVL
ncbi:hypothetical protein LTR62_005919 [Meristemomyces frigidus]|uniref:RRM domain-containing protein n=1 Tax=Meristemomyces frigidus TaxID=1508187 RepID=A0AAN7YJS6_9PEZI|nr:hypothetical protein LTR62_005919 [Meristemomyces frigidus]